MMQSMLKNGIRDHFHQEPFSCFENVMCFTWEGDGSCLRVLRYSYQKRRLGNIKFLEYLKYFTDGSYRARNLR